MNIFICIKYKEDCLTKIPEIKNVLESLGHKVYCFATDAEKMSDAKIMMAEAFKKIDESDILLVESSEQSFGVGIEAGYGFSKGKKIISTIDEKGEKSKTLNGISDDYIVYKDYSDLKDKLASILNV